MANSEIQGSISFTPSTLPDHPQGALAGALNISGSAADLLRQAAAGPTEVTLKRSSSPPTEDQALWTTIRNRTEAIGFQRYAAFIHYVLCEPSEAEPSPAPAPVPGAGTPGGAQGLPGLPAIRDRMGELAGQVSVYGVHAYQLLKLATHAFLLFEGGVKVRPPGGSPATDQGTDVIPGEESRLGRPISYDEAHTALQDYLQSVAGGPSGVTLPYIKRIVEALISNGSREESAPFCEQLLRHRVTQPALIELVWNYWVEQGYLVQSMNAVMLRFQNRRHAATEPLANLALDTLRPLSNLLWGRTQDAINHLSVSRRAHEYRYAYGFDLFGKAVADVAPLESRSRFIEAFHHLLFRAAEFYAADAITTVNADGFRLLQAIKEVHLVLAESANNQFDELKRQARVEMMIDQWLLARPEMREFLRGRAMVPYQEPWMGQVDTMRQLQKWGDGSVSHFHHLAVTGEQLLLSLRFGDWTGVLDAASAVNWARYWKPEVQTYIHSYHAVTGVPLDADMADPRHAEDRYAQPSLHLRSRQLGQAGAAALQRPAYTAAVAAEGAVDARLGYSTHATPLPQLARRTRAA
jgi:hypothetical protein